MMCDGKRVPACIIIICLRFYYVNEPEQLSCTVYYVIIVIRAAAATLGLLIDRVSTRQTLNMIIVAVMLSQYYSGYDEVTTSV